MVVDECRNDGPVDAPWTLVLAHGAGASMDSPFLVEIAARLCACGLRVVRFEFPYMAARRRGERRPPDREPVLRQAFHQIIGELAPTPEQRRGLVIGGKSLGGRIASLVADELQVSALICLGYPFHPPGRPEQLRTAHLATLRTPALIIQGERDRFGGSDDVAGYALAPSIEVEWLPDGDHSFVPRRRSGHTLDTNITRAVGAVTTFLARVSARALPP